MTSFPGRTYEVWNSSFADHLGEIHGAFLIDVQQTLMVKQTLDFLAEIANSNIQGSHSHNVLGFLRGMSFYDPRDPKGLWYAATFQSAADLRSFNINDLLDAVRELELHCDVNITTGSIRFLAITGLGIPDKQLMVYNRLSFPRGMALEIEERGGIAASLSSGIVLTSANAQMAIHHYSTGMALMAGEDAIAGLLDAAFMQFYLAAEAILGKHERTAAIQAGVEQFGTEFDAATSECVSHTYLARHRFFGHSHPKVAPKLPDAERAFRIAKQVLVARWTARKLISLEIGIDLTIREMRLYDTFGDSINFVGSVDQLTTEFALP